MPKPKPSSSRKLAAKTIPLEMSVTPDRFKRSGKLKSKFRYTAGGPDGGGRVPTFTVEKTAMAPRQATFGGTRKGKGATIKRLGKA